jgi:phosphatidylglycerol:prolipoprotein diacylglycerol transferase
MITLVCYIYIKYHHLKVGRWADILAPTAMTTLFFGRIGCFLNGCCYGSPAPKWLPFKVVYPIERMPLHLAGIPLHPTPLYESLATGLIIFGFVPLVS